MGFRFRKSINIGKHFRINLSKSGIGYSIGGKGFRYTKTASGRDRITTSIPGTGISYVTENKSNNKKFNNTQNKTNKKGCLGCLTFIIIFFVIMGFVGSFISSAGSKITEFKLSEYQTNNVQVFVNGESGFTSSDYKKNVEVDFYVYPTLANEDDFKIVTSNTEIADISLREMRSVPSGKLAIINVSAKNIGNTSFYLESINTDVKSEVINVTVGQYEQPIDNSPMVYVNYSGKKYHYSANCAGKSAYQITLNNAISMMKEPCSKCVGN